MLLEAGTQNGAGQEPQLLTGCTNQAARSAAQFLAILCCGNITIRKKDNYAAQPPCVATISVLPGKVTSAV
jgi:hypothetical protein